MTVERLIDDYLAAVRRIVGAGPAPAGTTTVPMPPALDLPGDWAGPASKAAITASEALQQSRQRLTNASSSVATLTKSAADIAQQAATQLDVINGEWGQAKAVTAVITPVSLRDAALIPAAQTTIDEAVTLITDTAAKYADAAAAVRTHAATLPQDQTAPAASPPADAAATDELFAGEPLMDQSAPFSDQAMAAAAAGNQATAPASLLAAMAGMAPEMMGPAMELPGTLMPMAASLPAAAAPLGGMLSPLFNSSGTPSTATTLGSHIGKPGTVTAAIEEALDVLGITDPEARQHWREGYQTLIRRESSFDTHAINNSDSNAVGPVMADGGHAGSSRGLAQVIPSTFHAYHVAGTRNDIFDPVANIAASMNYVMHRYHVSPTGQDLAQKVAQANPHSAGGGY